MSKVIVIGAGAAGMIAAYSAASCGHHVIVIEKNDRPGKKLYITGKGRCNLTNDCDVETLLANVMTNRKFLYSAFHGFTSQDMMRLMASAGLKLKVERGQRVFPQSDKSSDVIRTMQRLLEKNNVKMIFGQAVCELVLDQKFSEMCKVRGVRLQNFRTLDADAVIVATGGLTYPSTGSTGDGYRFAERTGHVVTALTPSLVPMNVRDEWVRELQGLSLKNVCLSIYSGAKKIFEDFGEMLFTHFGISGPLVLSASAGIRHEIYGLRAVIDLKPALTPQQLGQRLLRDFEKYANKQFHNALPDLLPAKLIPVIVRQSGIDPYKKVNLITREERMRLVELIKHLTVHISGLRDFNEAVVTRGGVSVADVDPSTMASRHCKGLYFAGEVLDVDALTGGFNLQIAWSTGYLAGRSISAG